MRQGRSLQEVATEIKRQSALKDDYVLDTRELAMVGGEALSLPLKEGSGSRREFNIAKIAHRQISQRLGIPATYYDRLRGHENDSVRALLDANVNTLFREVPERRMIRTFGGEDPLARAFLSDRYRRRDNDQVAEHILPMLGEIPDMRMESSEVTDTRLYLKAIAPRVEGEVAKDDVVQAGVMIRNSEVGHGALVVQPIVLRLVCLNGMVVADATRSYHVGRTVEVDEEMRVFRDETMKLDDEAFFAKLADVVKAAVDETRFNDIIVKLRESRTGEKLTKPLEGIERLAQRFQLSEGEQESVLQHLIEGSDLTNYGVMNAVTRASQDVEDYDRATQLEEVGGQILAMHGKQAWAEVVA